MSNSNCNSHVDGKRTDIDIRYTRYALTRSKHWRDPHEARGSAELQIPREVGAASRGYEWLHELQFRRDGVKLMVLQSTAISVYYRWCLREEIEEKKISGRVYKEHACHSSNRHKIRETQFKANSKNPRPSSVSSISELPRF